MVKLSEQSDICKKHFSAGAIVSAAIYETEYRRLTTKKDISNEELKKIFFDRVERGVVVEDYSGSSVFILQFL